MEFFEKYSRDSLHFFSTKVPPLLRNAVECAGEDFTLVDLGCGDGNLIFALKCSGALESARSVMGVDLSPIRTNRFETNTGYKAIVSNAQTISVIPTSSVHLAISAMVIEHVSDDTDYLKEIFRILRPHGIAYVATVIRLKGAWYFRRNIAGERVLDSTHLREYSSKEAFIEICIRAGCEVEDVMIKHLKPPLLHPFLRLMNRIIRFRNLNWIFINCKWARILEKLTIPIPRYRKIEVILHCPKMT